MAGEGMIHYAVRCSGGHEFDGWFKDSASFDRQAKRGLLECPVCGDAQVARALMAPTIARTGARTPPPVPAPAPVTTPAPAAAPVAISAAQLPDQVRAQLQRMRAEIEKNCDYVGPGFADEARKIHRGEADPRGIYGETTPVEAEALADEGIEIASIPWVPRADG